MTQIYGSAPSAYDYPLLIKQLLNRAKPSLKIKKSSTLTKNVLVTVSCSPVSIAWPMCWQTLACSQGM